MPRKKKQIKGGFLPILAGLGLPLVTKLLGGGGNITLKKRKKRKKKSRGGNILPKALKILPVVGSINRVLLTAAKMMQKKKQAGGKYSLTQLRKLNALSKWKRKMKSFS